MSDVTPAAAAAARDDDVLDVVALSKHQVIPVRSVDVEVDLADVGRPLPRTRLHRLQAQ